MSVTRVILTADKFHIGEMPKLKEKTVKIKANKNDTSGNYLSGDVFEARFDEEFYFFTDTAGISRVRLKEEFTIIPGEPVIEVGSEWVNAHGKTLTVICVASSFAICKWNSTGKEFASSIKNHLKFYKPKPKTVTMYFYRDYADSLLASDFEPRIYNTLFTREIELP